MFHQLPFSPLKCIRSYSSNFKKKILINQKANNSVSVFSSSLPKKPNIVAENSGESLAKYNTFWKFFLEVADDLHKITCGEDHVFQLLANEITKVHSRLHFEIDKGF